MTRRLTELVEGNGVAIFEMSETFGGGSLNAYGINSNTSAISFIRYMTDDELIEKLEDLTPADYRDWDLVIRTPTGEKLALEALNEYFDKKDAFLVRRVSLPAFRDLYPHSDIIRSFIEADLARVPLVCAGHL